MPLLKCASTLVSCLAEAHMSERELAACLTQDPSIPSCFNAYRDRTDVPVDPRNISWMERCIHRFTTAQAPAAWPIADSPYSNDRNSQQFIAAIARCITEK